MVAGIVLTDVAVIGVRLVGVVVEVMEDWKIGVGDEWRRSADLKRDVGDMLTRNPNSERQTLNLRTTLIELRVGGRE